MADKIYNVLFVCTGNSARSIMAEGLMKQMYGQRAYVQSAGVRNDMEVDGFSVAVCKEMGIELSRHRSRSFEEMQEWGDDLSQFDLIVALSGALRVPLPRFVALVTIAKTARYVVVALIGLGIWG